ncbi:MAG: ATP-binding protein [Desulfuromonadales bacterium]
MAIQLGLRTEIIVNLCVLVGAALLFSGFLLLNLLERDLVRNQTVNARRELSLIAQMVENSTGDKGETARRALAGTSVHWALYDADLQIIDAEPAAGTLPAKPENLAWIRFEEEPISFLEYSSFYIPGHKDNPGTVTITVPLRRSGRFAGVLQGRYSLASVTSALTGASQLYLSFLALYGGVLLLFGFWLLGKTVVRPVRQLTFATTRIAGGDLQPVLVPEGPREIAILALSFNQMTSALQESRARSDRFIASLQQANEKLRRTRDDLVRAERLASVGHLAAGMAHEIGNPLGAIIGYLDLLEKDLPPGREQEMARHAGIEANRIHRLVQELLNYSRPDQTDSVPVDPAPVLAEAVELLTHQGALSRIDLVKDFPSSLPKIGISHHKLLQVCINLLLNARDALGAADKKINYPGKIWLEGAVNDDEVWITIRDTGKGIAPAVLPHIFDPFFTTKGPGEGRGLGLAVCHRIVVEAGGKIEVMSGAEGGSTFIVRLKALAAEAA